MKCSSDTAIVPSPVGELTLGAGPGGLRAVLFAAAGESSKAEREESSTSGVLAAAASQLGEYFDGKRREFELPLDLDGTPLQLRVWELLREIPFGATVSYGELTGQIDSALFPDALEPWRRVRAAAAEVGRTPTPIVIPCHRVIGADGSLVGYGGGLERKGALLDRERAAVAGAVPAAPWGAGQMALV